MTATYSKYADICAKFYELTLDSEHVADFVFKNCSAKAGQQCLFVGGMFGVAERLLAMGLDLTVIDYTEEMVFIGKSRMPNAVVQKADLRDLPFNQAFDLVIVVGRVFTHMITNDDLIRGLAACYRALRSNGKLFADNYEDILIQKTSYFNGLVEGRDSETHILRSSSTKLIGTNPFVVQWSAEYSGHISTNHFKFRDSIKHRAFSRVEFSNHLKMSGFEVEVQGDNFDETSFYTLARKR